MARLIDLGARGGNRATASLVRNSASRTAGPQTPLLQRWTDYSVKYAARIRSKIIIYADRVQHAVDRHGVSVVERSSAFYTFNTDDNDTIEGWIKAALAGGAISLGKGGAFYFEHTLGEDVGQNNKGTKTRKIRVVVVETGRYGNKGKVQTAYPIV